MDNDLEIKAGLKIQKPAHEVFEAIVDPEKMSNYFVSKSSGRMEEGKTLHWRFPEFDMQIPVKIEKIDPDRFISFSWGAENDTTKVTITIKSVKEDDSFIAVTEGSKKNNEEGIKWLGRNTEGWANFLACMKAYLEYGINLRKGAFDPSQMPEDAIQK